MKIFLFSALLVAIALNANSQNQSLIHKQEICVLINVLDHDYEKIDRETFEKISSIGYKTIELGNYSKPFSARLSATYCDLKFNTLACGGSLYDLQTNIDSVITKGLRLHQKYVICYWPWLDGAENVTIEQCKQSAKIMNKIAEKCKNSGLKFSFHNHGVEFKKIEGKLICDYLLEFSDPSLVFLEFDIYHALKAELDPIKYMKAHVGRIQILHLFAMDASKDDVVAGDDMPEFERMIQTSKEIGVEYLVVEGNDLKNPLLYIEKSFERLQKLNQ